MFAVFQHLPDATDNDNETKHLEYEYYLNLAYPPLHTRSFAVVGRLWAARPAHIC
jgi:hypothetical protein